MLYQLSYGIVLLETVINELTQNQGFTPCFERAKIKEIGLCANYLYPFVDKLRFMGFVPESLSETPGLSPVSDLEYFGMIWVSD